VNVEQLREYCLSKPHTFECFPFDEDTLVFKVGSEQANRMFAFISLERGETIALKCDPERSIELRDRHPEIQPAYHMNKHHWNDVYAGGSLPHSMITELIDHSYELNHRSLPKYIREALDKD